VASAASSLAPDLTISASDITISPQSPKTGETLTITATVRNTGTKDANNVLVQFSIYNTAINSSLIIDSQTVALVPMGGGSTVSLSWDTTGLQGGSYNIISETDPSNNIPELNEENNQASVPLYLTAPQGTDIVISQIDRSGVSSDTQTRSFSGTVSITLKNAGNQTSLKSFVLTAFEDRNNNMAFDPGTDNIVDETYWAFSMLLKIRSQCCLRHDPVHRRPDICLLTAELPQRQTNQTILMSRIFTMPHSNVDKL
jgi:hypothetical protein